jgi:nicotinate-nucleotide--dimethylbenzimidazole phosphoribosyltransferase
MTDERGKTIELKIKKINYGTKNFTKGPAMAIQEAERSIMAGFDVFAEENKKMKIDIAGTGDMGIGNTASSSAITAVFTGKDVADVTGRGTGISDEVLAKKIEAIEKGIKINDPDPQNALDILSKIGGFEIGGLAGIMLAGAAAKIPVVIDGFISGAAALIACGLEPRTKDYLIASHCSVEQGHRIILEYLGLKPLLDLDLRLGEGTGAALGINLAEASIRILTEMATFDGAGVAKKVSSN